MSWSLRLLQAEHEDWAGRNFPGAQPHDALLGIMEEVGELAHAHLKHDQGIRGYDDEKYRTEAADAIGDIVVYLASYCNRNGFDLQICVEDTWRRVQERDWILDPQRGGT